MDDKNIAFVVRKDKVDEFLSGTTKGNLQKVLARADKHRKKGSDINGKHVL